MTVEILYPLLTEAIRRAEALEDLGAPGARSAYLDVSLLEERVSEALPASDPEGALARVGAVRGAVSARDFSRAQQLSERFLGEAGANERLRDELLSLAREAEEASAIRYPHVAVQFGFAEIRRLAQALIQQGAPFPIG